MIIEINKDIEQYKESVALGLSAKQLIFSAVSILCGGGIVLLLYPYVGLTVSAYIAIPVVAPIALGGFYTFNNMTFYDVIKRKVYFMFANKALVYSSTECEQEIKDHLNSVNTEKYSFNQKILGILFGKKNVKLGEKKVNVQSKESKEEFENMKRKTKKIAIGCIATMVLVAAGAIVYKAMN